MSPLERSSDVDALRRSLDSWKEVLVAAKKIIDWEQNFYPGVIVGVITFQVDQTRSLTNAHTHGHTHAYTRAHTHPIHNEIMNTHKHAHRS